MKKQITKEERKIIFELMIEIQAYFSESLDMVNHIEVQKHIDMLQTLINTIKNAPEINGVIELNLHKSKFSTIVYWLNKSMIEDRKHTEHFKALINPTLEVYTKLEIEDIKQQWYNLKAHYRSQQSFVEKTELLRKLAEGENFETMKVTVLENKYKNFNK
jgi:hypothetical protein